MCQTLSVHLDLNGVGQACWRADIRIPLRSGDHQDFQLASHTPLHVLIPPSISPFPAHPSDFFLGSSPRRGLDVGEAFPS